MGDDSDKAGVTGPVSLVTLPIKAIKANTDDREWTLEDCPTSQMGRTERERLLSACCSAFVQ